jgi:hypothetical protein
MRRMRRSSVPWSRESRAGVSSLVGILPENRAVTSRMSTRGMLTVGQPSRRKGSGAGFFLRKSSRWPAAGLLIALDGGRAADRVGRRQGCSERARVARQLAPLRFAAHPASLGARAAQRSRSGAAPPPVRAARSALRGMPETQRQTLWRRTSASWPLRHVGAAAQGPEICSSARTAVAADTQRSRYASPC